jgi:hypothetical protein
MKREVCKFFSGASAALAYAHAAYAVATSHGIINEPVFLGRRWGVKIMWTEAAIYSAASVALGYAGWAAKPQGTQPNSVVPQTDGQTGRPAGVGSESQLTAR